MRQRPAACCGQVSPRFQAEGLSLGVDGPQLCSEPVRALEMEPHHFLRFNGPGMGHFAYVAGEAFMQFRSPSLQDPFVHTVANQSVNERDARASEGRVLARADEVLGLQDLHEVREVIWWFPGKRSG